MVGLFKVSHVVLYSAGISEVWLGGILPCGDFTFTPVLPKSRHTLKMMVSGLFVEFEVTVNHIINIILNTVTMRTYQRV